MYKVSIAGWSERRVQRWVEETWAENAKRIAAATAETARQMHAEFVLVGGDVRERTLVMDALPEAVRRTAVTVDREAEPDLFLPRTQTRPPTESAPCCAHRRRPPDAVYRDRHAAHVTGAPCLPEWARVAHCGPIPLTAGDFGWRKRYAS